MSQDPHIAAHAARILIVDDDPDNREVLGIILGYEGFSTLAAGSGEEALTMLAAARLAQQPVDLILLDVILPGMSGYEVAAMAKRDPATKDIPIIMVTAMDDLATRTRALHSGAEDFLTKPLDRNELRSHVTTLLTPAPRPTPGVLSTSTRDTT